jgi:hypothetical protein
MKTASITHYQPSGEGALENEKTMYDTHFTGLYKKEKGQWRIAAVRCMIPPSELL